MDNLIPSLGFIFGQTSGALIVLMSFKMLKVGLNEKDWAQLIIGVVVFLMGAYVVAFTLIFALTDDFNKFELTYSWTLVVSILLIYFLYFYFPKTKFYKQNLKFKKKSSKINDKSSNEKPSLFDWFGAIVSDLFMLIFALALAIGFLYLLVKLVKYFWYV
tara:strand:+ start:197 stop:676 length:480 start_codon:yes stop_codon:yes gene_type:complete